MFRAVSLLCLAAAAALAQAPADIVLRQQFQTDTEGWTSLNPEAELRVETPTLAGEQAAGRLVFSYDLGGGKRSGAIMRAPEGFERARRIRFRAQSDHATGMALLLTEKKPGGGNYAAWFWLPAGQPQTVELTPADFTATDGPGDPVDSDGKLDLDSVEGIGLFDLTQFFGEVPTAPGAPIVLTAPDGHNTVTLQDFEILATPAPSAHNPANLASFNDRDFLDWVTLGGMDLTFSPSANPIGGRALEAAYRQLNGQMEVMLRRVSGEGLAKATRLQFDIASERESTLVVSVEMKKTGGGQGPRFTLPIYAPGDKELFHVDLKLADFQGDGRFDPAQWRSLAIIDITNTGGGDPAENHIWIANVRAVE